MACQSGLALVVAGLVLAGCLTQRPGIAMAGDDRRWRPAPPIVHYDPSPRLHDYRPTAPYWSQPRYRPHTPYYGGPPVHRRHDPCVRVKRGAPMVRELGLYHQRIERIC
jgi:hypothetical protein